jgi:uncharacterized protein (DUF433 family)
MARLTERITVSPRPCGGRPCVRGMRIRVSDVSELLASGITPRQILADHPDLGLEDIRVCLRRAKAVVLTKDQGFVILVERLRPTPPVMCLTCGNVSNSPQEDSRCWAP